MPIRHSRREPRVARPNGAGSIRSMPCWTRSRAAPADFALTHRDVNRGERNRHYRPALRCDAFAPFSLREFFMNSASGAVVLIGRILLAVIFVRAGYGQLTTTAAMAATMASHGIPLSNILVYGAIALELIGGLMLMAGLYARWAAGALCLYTLALALIFHAYWAVPAAEARIERDLFFGHLSMMGGMLMVVALGAGSFS